MSDLIDELFPFHVTIGAAGEIVSVGRSLRRVLPDAQGRPFVQVFDGVRPTLQSTEDVAHAIGDVVLLQLHGFPLQLRGQFVRTANGQIAFVGSPRVVGLSSIEAWPVGIQDYAPHDASADYAMVLEAMSLQLKDLETMVGRLQDAERIERSLRERAEAANLAKSNFLANISHEIRTPMTAVLGYAELLRDPDLGREERADAVETIVRNGNHLMRILNDLLDLSKIEAGRMDIDRREFSLVRLLRDVRDLMEVNANARGNSLALRLDIEAAHDHVIGDSTRIRQVLLNLVGNAVKFTKGARSRSRRPRSRAARGSPCGWRSPTPERALRRTRSADCSSPSANWTATSCASTAARGWAWPSAPASRTCSAVGSTCPARRASGARSPCTPCSMRRLVPRTRGWVVWSRPTNRSPACTCSWWRTASTPRDCCRR